MFSVGFVVSFGGVIAYRKGGFFMVRNLKFGTAVGFLVALFCFGIPVHASPDLGVKFPAFKLQGLDSQFYGTEGA